MSLVFQKILMGYNFNERYSTRHNMNHIHVWQEYKNCCLEKIRHGDDLYMIVWDTETNKPKEVKYASESVNSFSKYSCYVDATPEFIEKYECWKNDQVIIRRKENRNKELSKLLSLRRAELLVLNKNDLKLKSMRNVYDLYGYDIYMKILLIINKSFRNQFKKDFRQKLITLIVKNLKMSYYDLNILKGMKL